MKEINNLLRNNLSTTSIKKIEYNSTNYTTPDDIGNALNSHFTELDRNKLPSCHPPQGSYQTPLFSTPSLLQEANNNRSIPYQSFQPSVRTGIFPKGLEISKSNTYIQKLQEKHSWQLQTNFCINSRY